MATSNNDREGRRRKIMDRSSDRLAMITGQSHESLFSPSGLQESLTKEEQLQVTSKNQTMPKATNLTPPQTSKKQGTFFSSRRLNSCIISSETTRSFCAFVTALLVVLSHIDYPLIGRSKSVLSFRPLYILLITDASIVLTRLYLETRVGGGMEENEDGNVVSRAGGGGGADNWAGAEKLLERCLVAYQTVRAIFIDCSVYIVVVIFGMCCLGSV